MTKKKKTKRVIDADNPQAGDREAIKASEEVIRRNLLSVMQHGNDTRRALVELREMFDALQAGVIAMRAQVNEMRTQLSVLQGEFYKRGTTSYSDEPEEETPEAVPDRTQGEDAAEKRISFP